MNPSEIHDQDDQEKKARTDKQRAVQALKTEVSDITWLMSSKQGRRIVQRMLSDAGVFRSVFNTNALQMAFAEGNRNRGLALLDMVIKNCPTQYAELLQESKE